MRLESSAALPPVGSDEAVRFQTLDRLSQLSPAVRYGFSPASFGNMSEKWAAGTPGGLEAVAANKARFAILSGIDLRRSVHMVPVHGNNVSVVDKDVLDNGRSVCADSLITTEKGVALTVFPADCAPIIITNSGCEFVALVHGSAKSTQLQVVRGTVEKLKSIGFKDTKGFIVGIGPAIGCYPVYDNGSAQTLTASWQPFAFEGSRDAQCQMSREALAPVRQRIRSSNGIDRFVDIAAYNIAQLVEAGVPKENIEDSGVCTVCQTLNGRLFSHEVTKIDPQVYPESRFMAYVQLGE